MNAFRSLKLHQSEAGNNDITCDQFLQGLRNCGVKLKEPVVAQLFSQIDAANSGTIDYQAFVQAIFGASAAKLASSSNWPEMEAKKREELQEKRRNAKKAAQVAP